MGKEEIYNGQHTANDDVLAVGGGGDFEKLFLLFRHFEGIKNYEGYLHKCKQKWKMLEADEQHQAYIYALQNKEKLTDLKVKIYFYLEEKYWETDKLNNDFPIKSFIEPNKLINYFLLLYSLKTHHHLCLSDCLKPM